MGGARGLRGATTEPAGTGPAVPAMAPTPTTAAGKGLFAQVGQKSWNELYARLGICNENIQKRGLKKIRNVEETFLTGYAYNEVL